MRLFDTHTKALVDLPAPPGPVRMYFCGPTVYARAHIGNARPFVIGMWLRSWLHATGYDVTLVHNITDVNDNIYAAAPGASAALAELATAWYLEDTADLGLGMPDHLPKVTEHIPPIISFIEQLVERGFADPVDGDVYFRVGRFPEYGRLSGQRPDQVEEDEEPNPRKEDPRDFALWKGNKPDEDTHWPSPWGEGRPGWHIECSAMAEELLGPAFEIHGGGLDLVFPHHENELAQSRALGHPFAAIWAHNGTLRLAGDKMSKSLGNIASIRDVLDQWGREAALVFFLGGHWRKPIDFSDETMAQAAAQVEGFREVFRGASEPAPDGAWEQLAAALDDDFNTPAALAVTCTSGTTTSCSCRGLGLFGLASLAEPGHGAARARQPSSPSRSATPRAHPATTKRQIGSAGTSKRPAGRSETSRAGTGSSANGELGPRLRSPRRPRGAARPAGGTRAARDRAGRRRGAVAGRGQVEAATRARALRARRHPRPPGRRRARRAVPLRRRVRARRRGAAAARGARPGHRPAQPRRRLPERRGGGCDRGRSSGAWLGRRDARRRPLLRRSDRASADRRRHESRPLPRGGEGARALGLWRGR